MHTHANELVLLYNKRAVFRSVGCSCLENDTTEIDVSQRQNEFICSEAAF